MNPKLIITILFIIALLAILFLKRIRVDKDNNGKTYWWIEWM